MKLVRGWGKRYAPDSTGGLRLSKARLYRAIGEEEGLGDRREGEFRMRMQGKVTSTKERSPLHRRRARTPFCACRRRTKNA